MSSSGDAAASVRLLDGKACSAAVMSELRDRLTSLRASAPATAPPPGLAVVLVGDRVDSATYVRMKKRACAELGITDLGVSLPGTADTAAVLAAVRALNADPRVHGILVQVRRRRGKRFLALLRGASGALRSLFYFPTPSPPRPSTPVQLPLPAGVDERAVLAAVSAAKDADGLHPANVGALVLGGRSAAGAPRAAAVACTPLGCLELLRRAGVPIAGKHAVVLGRSHIVGLPVAHLLLQADATVTICHSKTTDLPAIVRSADILVAAIGRPLFVQGDWLKPGAVVIDVGINAVPDASKASGSRLVGDVDFDAACLPGRAAVITPVPGGVGPMTIAMLMTNTVDAYERSLREQQQHSS